MNNFKTHYDNLKVARNAPDPVIRAAYKMLMQQYHPDKFQGSNEEALRITKIIKESYDVLINPVKRAAHDAWISNLEALEKQVAQEKKVNNVEIKNQAETQKAEQQGKAEKTAPQTYRENARTYLNDYSQSQSSFQEPNIIADSFKNNLRLLFDYLLMCFFKNAPEELHPERPFITKCVAFYVVSGIIIEGLIGDPVSATIEVFLRLVFAFGLLAGLAFYNKKGFVLKQLLTAVFICENLIITLGIVVETLDTWLAFTEYEYVPRALEVSLLAWYLAIISYIFRRVFDFSRLYNNGFAFIYFGLTYGVPFLIMELI